MLPKEDAALLLRVSELLGRTTITEADRLTVDATLARVSCGFASRLYGALCAVCEDGDVPRAVVRAREQYAVDLSAWVSTPADVDKFCSFFLLRGDFVDKLIDCAELSPATRERRWTSDRAARDALRETQLRTRTAQGRESARALSARRATSLACDMLRFAQARARRTPDWAAIDPAMFVLTAPDDEVTRCPKTFWYDFSTERLPPLLLAALVHRLSHLRDRLGRQHFPQSFALLDDAASLASPRPRWRDVVRLLAMRGCQFHAAYRTRLGRRLLLRRPFERAARSADADAPAKMAD